MAGTHSRHEVAVFLLCQSSPRDWFTNRDVATITHIGYRTARAHTARLVRLGVVEQQKLFPGYRFRLTAKLSASARAYVAELREAAQVYGLR